MPVVTRFAPSPTGFLHIGGARTALYNWLFAKHHEKYGDGGKYLLRIEDTDRKRSTNEAVEAIYDGLSWLGLDWDGDAVSQYDSAARHVEVAEQLLAAGHAYKCYCSPEELTQMREQAKAEGRSMRYDGRWRDRDASEAPAGVDPVIRLKAPTTGETVINDLVQGEVRVANEQLDDMVLLRADKSPTYMLAVVVDDHDMGITHVIRGDDHLNNAFRQFQLYQAMGWDVPAFAHISLIHGADGAKLSKRHGALGVDAYRDDGFLPQALRNYLLRLGWSHGDDEIISTEQAIEWFNLDSVGRAPTRFDVDKLTNLNGHYIRNASDQELADIIMPMLSEKIPSTLDVLAPERVKQGMSGLKERAKTIIELCQNSIIYAQKRPLSYTEKAASLIDDAAKQQIKEIASRFLQIEDWKQDQIESAIREQAEAKGLKLGKVAQPLRAALTGTTVSPSIFEVMEIFGQDETLARLNDAESVNT